MPLKKLIKGYRSFHQNYFKKDRSLYNELAHKGQSPKIAVIACSDSRTDPSTITNSEPGDIFVIRNVAAIVPPYEADEKHHGTSAAIEYAVKSLKTPHLVVMGHSHCGGVNALHNLEDIKDQFDFVPQWVAVGKPALDAIEKELSNETPDVRERALEKAVIIASLNNLKTYPWIAEAVENGDLELHGWYFDIKSGTLLSYDENSRQFADVQQALFQNAS